MICELHSADTTYLCDKNGQPEAAYRSSSLIALLILDCRAFLVSSFQGMNYLAHAYLSFERPAIIVGNLISNFVKGKKKFDYPVSIQQGMQLHRSIDQFTDAHAITKEAAAFF